MLRETLLISSLVPRYRSPAFHVQSWYDEVKDYTYPYPHECNPWCPERCSGPMCTHYTQVSGTGLVLEGESIYKSVDAPTLGFAREKHDSNILPSLLPKESPSWVTARAILSRTLLSKSSSF